jgi:hypothetical protein
MRRWLLCALAFLFAACDALTSPASDAPTVEAITIDTTVANALARVVTVRLSRPAPARVTWGAEGTKVLTLVSDSVLAEHRFLVPRLRQRRTYTLEAVAEGEASAPVRRTTFTMPAMPSALFAATFTATGTPSHPVQLIEIVGASGGLGGLLMVEDGEIVGHLPVVGSLFGATRRASGTYVLLDPVKGLVEQRIDGSTMRTLPHPATGAPTAYGRIHHDVIATPQNTLLFIANETRLVGVDSIVGEALWEWVPETGAVTKRWSAFTELDWNTLRGSRSVPGNWLHGNAISYGPRGNVLMSLRNADHVISIAPDFSRIEWRLGGPTGTLAIDSADVFLGQHYVTEPTPGRVLIFDNGWERPGVPYSRAIEFGIDTIARRATRVWQHRPAPDIYAALVGSARRTDDGRTLVLFGMLQGQNGSTGPITAIEVSSTGAERWRLTAGGTLTRLYRITPVDAVAGEVEGAFRGR